METLEQQIATWLAQYQGKDTPLIIIAMPLTDDILILAKKIMIKRQADILVLANEVELAIACVRLRINDSQFYGVLNPKDHNEKESWVKELMTNNGEITPKMARKMVENVDFIIQKLLNENPKAGVFK